MRVDGVEVGLSTYVVSLLKVLQEVKCPVPGCLEVVYSTGALRGHFMYHHFISKVAVVQEGTDMMPRCDLYELHMPAGRLITPRRTPHCDKNYHTRRRRRDVAIAARCSEATFILTWEEEAKRIEGVEVFKYLGQRKERQV